MGGLVSAQGHLKAHAFMFRCVIEHSYHSPIETIVLHTLRTESRWK